MPISGALAIKLDVQIICGDCQFEHFKLKTYDFLHTSGIVAEIIF